MSAIPSSWSLPRTSAVEGSRIRTRSSLVATTSADPSAGTNSLVTGLSTLPNASASAVNGDLAPDVRWLSKRVRSTVQMDPSAPADEQAVAGLVEGQAGRAGDRDGGDEAAGLEVVRAQLGAGDDVDPVAEPVARVRIVGSGLDEGVADRNAEIRGRRDAIVAPRDHARGHRVLREVRMGPFVDGVVDPVAPVLEKLGRRAGVVDLVEVHLVRLGQPEHPDAEDRRDQDHEDPHVKPVEAARWLGLETPRPVGSHGTLMDTRPETIRSAPARRTRPARSRSGAERPPREQAPPRPACRSLGGRAIAGGRHQAGPGVERSRASVGLLELAG